jgi:hypothetical protein
MSRHDTTFLGEWDAAESTDEEVIDAVRAVPCHY